MNEIEFWIGNPSIDVIHGRLTLTDQVKSNLLWVYDIPTSQTLTDLLEFFSFIESDVLSMKIMRGEMKKSYMVLMKVTNQDVAE